MQKIYFLSVLMMSLLGLIGCHGMVGNVIPQSGPSMEEVYDNMGSNQRTVSALKMDSDASTKHRVVTDLEDTRRTHKKVQPSSTDLNSFRKLPNPELKLYVYPHFAGTDEIPIPGYYTAFNAYEKTHYALTSETTL